VRLTTGRHTLSYIHADVPGGWKTGIQTHTCIEAYTDWHTCSHQAYTEVRTDIHTVWHTYIQAGIHVGAATVRHPYIHTNKHRIEPTRGTHTKRHVDRPSTYQQADTGITTHIHT